MLSTEKITPSMFPEVYDAILHDWNPDISRDRWQSAFAHHWPCDEDHFGYALADGGRIVGMLGMLFSQRPIRGRMMRFCNLHAWHVKPDYRAASLALMKPALDLKAHILTDFTPSPAVSAIAKRLGFQHMDSTVFVLPPLPSNRRRSSDVVRDLVSPDGPDAAQLDQLDARILRDHHGIDCGHMLVDSGGKCCYLVYSRITQHRLPFCLIHYVSNPQVFVEHHAAVRGHLMRQARSRFVVVEARLLKGLRVPLAFRIRGNDKLYRGTEIAPDEIDTLYSEIVLFKHSPLPGLRGRLSAAVKQCIPPRFRRFIGIGGEEASQRARCAAR